jgi:hypothetical protein
MNAINLINGFKNIDVNCSGAEPPRQDILAAAAAHLGT